MTTKTDIYSVSRLNQEVRSLLESGIGSLWLEAEISNLAIPASGHWYFSLKDSRSQIRCAMFRGKNRQVAFNPRDGDQILVRARVSLYEPRGDFQLIVEQMEAAGEGALRAKFEQLKLTLQAEGLFDTEHKQDFPALPTTVGIITSSTGAAVHDILTVLKRRFPAIGVMIYPCMVQGETAAASIVARIEQANLRQECDALIVGRGGGSLEDLWSFNEESVARAIFASDIPIVTGIGHEVDVTIADFVADHRAATPSAAAEFVSPDCREWFEAIAQWQASLIDAMQRLLHDKARYLQLLQSKLQHPGQRLQQQMQRVDYLQRQLAQHMQHCLAQRQQQLAGLARALDAYSPLATLGRGYAIVNKGEMIVRDAAQVAVGERLDVRLAKGGFCCEVTG